MPRLKDINKVMIISSGPIIIGQACEFDYSGTQACKALRRLGYITTLAAGIAAARGIAAFRKGHGIVKALQSYHSDIQ